MYTGLRPGEKLHEVLFTTDEVADVTSHPLITRLTVPPLTPDHLAGMDCHDVAGMGALATAESKPALPASATLH